MTWSTTPPSREAITAHAQRHPAYDGRGLWQFRAWVGNVCRVVDVVRLAAGERAPALAGWRVEWRPLTAHGDAPQPVTAPVDPWATAVPVVVAIEGDTLVPHREDDR